ncbi:hypothetical protein [Kiloniella sp.]|uniref:hypothetical protein n=1 Tax=Kiloniella sp. TaxID=1938587 RepID=UPI003B01067E
MSESNVPRTPGDENKEITTSEITTEQTNESIEAIGQEATTVPVDLPPIGTTQTYQSLPGQRLELSFDATQAAATVEGPDLILSFDLDADGTPESQIIFQGLAGDFDAGQSPQLVIDGTEVASEQLINLVLAQAGDLPLETAAGAGAGPAGGGGNRYDDNLGSIIDLLNAQGVIPPTELEFGLPEPVPDIVPLVENSPPLADNVVTPVQFNFGGEGGEYEGSNLPEDLIDALENVEGGGIIAQEAVFVSDGGESGSVQYVSFTLTEPTAVKIETDGPTIDPQIYLLEDDGERSLDDILATDDDDGPPAGSWYNSIIETGDEIGILPPGDYIVAVSDFHLSEDEAVSGVNGGEGGDSGLVTITVTELGVVLDDSDIVMFKQLDVDGTIGDDDGGVIGTFGGSDGETPLESLVFTLESLPQYGTLLLVTEDGSSIMGIGDTFDSTDTVWWFATEDQIENYLEENEQQFLPNPTFDYSVTDEDGGVAQENVTITLPPPEPPEASVYVSQGECLNEDTQGQLGFDAYPTDPNSKISEIVISGFPTGSEADAWVVDADSVYIGGADFTSSYNSSTGELTITIDISDLDLGEGVHGYVDVTPNPDSDVDHELTIEATAVNGGGGATGDSSNTIPVDADADGGEQSTGGADDGDAQMLAVSVSVADDQSEDPDNTTFQLNEVGSVTVNASFDDFTDGSETHTVAIFAAEGYNFLEFNEEDLPAGVTLTSFSASTLVFDVETLNGVENAEITVPVQLVSEFFGESDFTARVIAEETSTGDIECEDIGGEGGEGGIYPLPGDNVAFADDDATAVSTNVEPPEVSLSLPGEVQCLQEDSDLDNGDNQVTLSVDALGDDEITEITISGFQDDWTYDFSNLEFDGAVLTDSDASDGSITISVPNWEEYEGSFAVQPPNDSDVDHPTLNAVATVVDGVDPDLSTTGDGSIDIHVDADADGPGGEGGGVDDGDDFGLSVSASIVDSSGEDPENTSFQDGEVGTLSVSATFDDFLDGSEEHYIGVIAPDGFDILTINTDDLPAGVTLNSNDGTTAIFQVDTTDGVGFVDFDLAVQNVDSETGEADFVVKAVAHETNTGDVECDFGGEFGGEEGITPSTGDNHALVQNTATAVVTMITPPEVSLTLPDEVDCIHEDSSTSNENNEVTLTVNPADDDEITQIVITGFQDDWDYDLAGLLTGGASFIDGDPAGGSIGSSPLC